MKSATAVIGANYGDEGKGLVVDKLASAAGKSVVVRFNGGAQAGHTVTTADARHVFKHFGAGTLAGSETYLAKHFVCNPVLFWQEAQRLGKLGIRPIVATDPRCFVTTPYDMIVNQIVEDSRGAARHGSVGVGFGETVGRNDHPAFQLWRSDLGDAKKVAEKLKLIRDRWLPERLRRARATVVRDDKRMTDDVMDFFVRQCVDFHAATKIAGAEFLVGKNVIFEGAQGLGLDMDRGAFPHVTRSNTGLKNVLPIARAAHLDLNVIYVTRAYLTRHGAGPLAGEFVPDPPIIDETNVLHAYQGDLRFAPLDTGEVKRRIAEDLALAPGTPASVALTCVDQIDPLLLPRIEKALRPSMSSNGPTRADVNAHRKNAA